MGGCVSYMTFCWKLIYLPGCYDDQWSIWFKRRTNMFPLHQNQIENFEISLLIGFSSVERRSPKNKSTYICRANDRILDRNFLTNINRCNIYILHPERNLSGWGATERVSTKSHSTTQRDRWGVVHSTVTSTTHDWMTGTLSCDAHRGKRALVITNNQGVLLWVGKQKKNLYRY